MPQLIPKYDLTLARGNLLAVMVLLLASSAALAVLASEKNDYSPHGVLPIDRGRVALADEKIDPNTAPPASLRRLHRMGPKLTEALVQYRQQYVRLHDRPAFVYAEDLDAVKGIGPEMASQYKEHLCLPSADN
jgi:DNA uptake protein ComE-like DNA-binding protein